MGDSYIRDTIFNDFLAADYWKSQTGISGDLGRVDILVWCSMRPMTAANAPKSVSPIMPIMPT